MYPNQPLPVGHPHPHSSHRSTARNPFRTRIVVRDSFGLLAEVRTRTVGACEIVARFLRCTSYDAHGLRAGATIAVLGGRCARSGVSEDVWQELAQERGTP